jgi:hypothetical protein
MRAYTKPRLWLPYDTVLPGPISHSAKKGMELVDLRTLGILPAIMGGAPREGYHAAADVVTQTADGRDINVIWSEFMTLLNAVNEERQALIRFLTFPVARPVDTVTLPGDGVEFEEASEFGEPVGARISPPMIERGYTFKWYDLAARYTWQFLADATSEMVNAVANASVEAFYRRQLFTVLKRIFNPTQETTSITGQPGAGTFPVFGFYNADGEVPPPYKTNTFLSTHSHYKALNNASDSDPLQPADLDTLVIDDFAEHGYRMEEGYRLVTMVHTGQGNQIRTFKKGTEGARYDFIPASNQPGQFIDLTTQLVGQTRIGPTLEGLSSIGTYGPLIIVEDDWLPENYVFSFATGGSESLQNPVGLREHAQANLRGLRLVKGRNPDYPLLDSFWATGFGAGVRQRGAGIVLQVSDEDNYAAPAVYA